MRRWTVKDRQEREVYLTEERWEHILSKHAELTGRLNDVLDTVRLGRRRQSKQDPNTFLYSRRNEALPVPYNTIIVCVAFRQQHSTDIFQTMHNNFITTAWGEVAG